MLKEAVRNSSDLSNAVLVTMEFNQRSSNFSIANEAKNNTQQNASFIVSLHYSMHIFSR